MSPCAEVATVPRLGSGLGYRLELRESILAAREGLDFVELLTDEFLHGSGSLDEVREVCDAFPAVPHGIGLSVGSATGLDRGYLAQIKRVSDITGSPYYSEHLCMTRAPGIDIGHLSPLRFTEEMLERTIRNVLIAQDFLEKPLVLENVTYVVAVPRGELAQTEFFRELVDATGCGVLLDLTNVYINAVNHGFEPEEFLDDMPLGHVVQVHLAGGYWFSDRLVDGHSEAVQEESWNLLELLARRVDVRACVIERDGNFPDNLEPLVGEVARARAIIGS